MAQPCLSFMPQTILTNEQIFQRVNSQKGAQGSVSAPFSLPYFSFRSRVFLSGFILNMCG